MRTSRKGIEKPHAFAYAEKNGGVNSRFAVATAVRRHRKQGRYCLPDAVSLFGMIALVEVFVTGRSDNSRSGEIVVRSKTLLQVSKQV